MTRLDQTLLLPALNEARGLVQFLGTDTESLWRQNRRNQSPQWPWHTQPVDYRLNSEGYRAPEWKDCNWSESLVLFGCSWAFGIGVGEDQTLAHYLSGLRSQPVINVSQGGSSIRWSCDQLALMLSRGLRPGAVAVVWTETTRWPWYGSLGPDQPRLSRDLYQAHAQDELHSDNRARLDIWGFRQMLALANVPLAEATWSLHTAEVMSVTLLPIEDHARDCQHPGPQSNYTAAKIISDLF